MLKPDEKKRLADAAIPLGLGGGKCVYSGVGSEGCYCSGYDIFIRRIIVGDGVSVLLLAACCLLLAFVFSSIRS